MIRDAAQLRSRAEALSARAVRDPHDFDARRGAAEALLRLAIIEGGDDALALLRRAAELDPYRGEVWLLLARADRDAGAHALAAERLDVAALLLPGDRRVALLRAKLLCAQASSSRSSELGDRAVAELEPLLGAAPDDQELLTAMLESLLHGKPSVMRKRAPALLAGLRPGPAIERIAYLVVLSPGIGDRYDDANQAVLEAAIALAARCNPSLSGVICAARAKMMTAEEICDRVDVLAASIADVRIVRLLLRERLATVADPIERLGLFERAMAKIPALDGITHDYLQLLHLVAKRSLATGDATTAIAHWRACLARDPDNLAALENLARLSATPHDTANPLAAQITELRRIYAVHSPRADLVLLRACATLVSGVTAELERTVSSERRLGLRDVFRLVRALMRGLALGRLARDPVARAATPTQVIANLLDDAAPVLDDATAVIAQPLFDEPPVAYALVNVAKDVPHDEFVARYTFAIERAPSEAWRTLVVGEVEPLLDPARRADYDTRTSGVELAELLRMQAHQVRLLLGAVTAAERIDIADRVEVVAMIRRLVPAAVWPYLRAELRSVDDHTLEAAFQQALLGPVLDAARRDFAAGNVEAGLDRLSAHADVATGCFVYHDLVAAYSALDLRITVEQAAEQARAHARRAVALRGPRTNKTPAEMASDGDAAFAERIAIQRAQALLHGGNDRAALDTLWWAHPDTEGKMPAANLPVLPWIPVARTGSPDYRLATAQAMRAATRAWYATQRASSRWAAIDASRSVMLALRTAFSWAHAARESAAGSESYRNASEQLLDLLRADRRQLLP